MSEKQYHYRDVFSRQVDLAYDTSITYIHSFSSPTKKTFYYTVDITIAVRVQNSGL